MSFTNSIRRLSMSIMHLPLKWLVKELQIPNDPKKEFDLNSDDHIIYVLRTKSLSSIELLRRQAEKLKLPTATVLDKELDLPESGSCIFLNSRPKWFSSKRALSSHKIAFAKIIEAQRKSPEKNFKLVPVSILWGRNPGKEKSFVRYFMSNIEEAGRLGKLFIILFLGRQCLIQYDKPISLLSKSIDKDSSPGKTATLLSRTLRIHFNRQWVAAMGPRTENKRDLIRGIVASNPVRDAIISEEKKSGKSKEKTKRLAEKYVKEISASFSPRMIRFLSSNLARLWNRIYSGIEVNNIKEVRELAKDHELIYVPCHRSHTDYLLLSYQLYHEGLVPPHIAAGINLNFWPIGPILRKGGAFFLRRSFKGNKLYTAVFNEYIYRLLNKGTSIEYFQEGGRSRTGRLLTPKTGMLSMTIQGMLRGVRKPIVFLPVFIGYERMFEGKSYVGELRGQGKKQESFAQLLGIRKALKRFYGKVYLNFGEPLLLNKFLDDGVENWRDHLRNDSDKPSWLNPQVIKLGDEINRRINAAVSINSVCLVSLALLGTPRQAMDKNELIAQLDALLAFAKDAPYSPYTNISEESGTALLENAIKLGMVLETSDPAGDVISIEGDEAILSTYYSNNILHIFAVASLIASIFQRRKTITYSDILDYVKVLYPFLKQELYIHWELDQIQERLDLLLKTMLKHGLLHKDKDNYKAPNTNEQEWSRLMLLAQAVQPALQRYAITLTLLQSLSEKTSIRRAELETESQKLAQRISALYGINAPEFSDKHLFRNQFKILKQMNYIVHQEGAGVKATNAAKDLYKKVLSLLSVPVQQGLQQASRSLSFNPKNQSTSELIVSENSDKNN